MNTELLLPKNLSCGYFDCSSFGELKESPRRKCNTFEIEYFLEDGKNTFSDGITYPIRRNFVLICSPGEERYSELPFKTKYAKFSVEGRLAEILRKAPRYFHICESLEANTLLDEIITLHTMKENSDILLNGKLLTYISLLLKNGKRSEATSTYQNETAISAEEYIKEHYEKPIKLCDIAKSVNLSPNYFHTIFSNFFNMTPHEYLKQHRIKVAKGLLLTTQLSISDIAEKCGFANQQYFTSVFKTNVGFSPAEFKRRHQKAYWI